VGHQADRFSEMGAVDPGRNEERTLAMKPFELSPPSPALLAVSVLATLSMVLWRVMPVCCALGSGRSETGIVAGNGFSVICEEEEKVYFCTHNVLLRICTPGRRSARRLSKATFSFLSLLSSFCARVATGESALL
jgi:hypothetical protein